ncbi:glutathione S-transferase family protein [Porticoccaceae bacterium]|nr:glutathione S-transferase [Porticoccaceae bacterium]MDC1143830.1 glutathione S-transferase family protein [Porticoccaceae bacterium]MDG2117150.1 glutathione S-transferase family protein [Porticoccaceae bacterium]|tara:strand:+ start:75 stop:824 length:750 start_codon:yes stop_codon:yes gene_type:complete
MALVLYNAAQSTCSQKVRLSLWEKGLAFEEVKLDLFQGDQLTAEYKQLNPNGVVPTLVNNDEVIIDSSVILEYLDDLFPEIDLRPESALARAQMRVWLRFFEEVPVPAIRIPSYNRVFLRHYQNMTEEEFLAVAEKKTLRKDFFLKMGRTGYSEAEMTQAMGKLANTIQRMEQALANGGPWLMGEYSQADISIIPVIMRMQDLGLGYLWDDCPSVADWFDRYRQRSALINTFYHTSLLSEQYGDVIIRS